MKPPPLPLVALLAFAPLLARAADTTVTLSDVHLCCNSCVKDAADAVSPVSGATAQVDKAGQAIKITASSPAVAQKAVDALVSAGFYGKSSDPAIHVAHESVASGVVKSVTVSGVHLCCNKCVSSFNKVVSKVAGVAGTTASKDAESFQITGNFDPKSVLDALNAAGFAANLK